MLINYQQASRVLAISETTLRKWVSCRRVPHVKLGRAVRFDTDELERWIESRSIREGVKNGKHGG